MAQYKINGGTYKLPDDLQGTDLESAINEIAAANPASTSPAPSKAVAPTTSAAPAPTQEVDRTEKIRSYADQTDQMVGLPAGTSFAQLTHESRLDSNAVSKRGAKGIAQVMPEIQTSLEKRFGRKLNATNDDDALAMHRELMRENMATFKNPDDALRAYNGGWDKSKWGNSETAGYVDKVKANKAYVPFAPVRKDIDPASLNKDSDWVRASKQMYLMTNREAFKGTDAEAAEWGKDRMGYFNYNLPKMALDAAELVRNGTPQDKKAFLYMMDTYDNTDFSWEGAGRAAKGIVTDPTNLVGMVTLGTGTVGRVVAGQAAKQGIREGLMHSFGRAGIRAGIENGVFAAADNTIRQGVEVNAGRKDGIHLGELAANTAVGAGAGAVLGTVADAALSRITRIVKERLNTREPIPTAPTAVPPTAAGAVTPNAAAAAPNAPASVLPNAPHEAPVNHGGPHPESATDPLTAALPPEVGPPVPPPELHTDGTPRVPEVLTEAEQAAAAKRLQEGRLPEDSTVRFDGSKGVPIDVPAPPTGARHTPQNNEATRELGRHVAQQLYGLDDETLGHTIENLRNGAFTPEQRSAVDAGVTQYAKEMQVEHVDLVKRMLDDPTNPKFPEWQARRDALEGRMSPVIMGNDALGSAAGSLLQQRKINPDFKLPTIEALMTEHGISKAEAERLYVAAAAQAQSTKAAQDIGQKYDRDIAKALENNDMKEVVRLQMAKDQELGTLVNLPKQKGTPFITKLNEYAISNVFSITTLAINAVPSGVKTIVLPAVRALVSNPLEKATRAQLSATYTGMASTVNGAFKAARAAYKYEQSILTRDTSRLLEGELAMTGKTGAVLRFFPRLLNATDEFLAQVNYNGFVAGKAAADAAYSGAEKGLKGDALHAFIKQSTEDAVKGSFKQDSADELLRPIINKGQNLGYTGEKLVKFVRKEAEKSPEALRHGSNEEALDFVRDVLYKRRFSGDGSVSSMAKSYEDFTMKHPWMKFAIGQMFFRTPVRVFEEGIRLTPGLNLVSTNMMKDLYGANGVARQIRAQGETMVGLSILGATLTLYSQGRLTGSGGYDDFKQNKLRTDAPVADAYTLKMDDGSTWNYRGFDPISTPVKIMVTGMELMNKLSIREAQGEMVGQSQWKQAQAHLMVGWMAVTSAIRDANLVAGLSATMDLGADLADPSKRSDAFLKLMGEKLKLLVPNSLHKIAKENDPSLKDPAEFWQMLETRLHLNTVGADIKTSYAYDVLGKVREPQETGQLWNIFSVATPEERARGMSNEAQVVLTELDRLQRETGAHFDTQHTHPLTGSFDPRVVMTKDGKETLYDRWQRDYRELNPDKILFDIVTQPMPDGTFKNKGIRVELIQSTIKQLQDAAYMKLMGDEQEVVNQYTKTLTTKAESQGGLHDFNNLNK